MENRLWWRPIATLKSTDGQVMLKGPSGYIEPNHVHIETGHRCPHSGRIKDDAGDLITEGWPEPTHWRPQLHN